MVCGIALVLGLRTRMYCRGLNNDQYCGPYSEYSYLSDTSNGTKQTVTLRREPNTPQIRNMPQMVWALLIMRILRDPTYTTPSIHPIVLAYDVMQEF